MKRNPGIIKISGNLFNDIVNIDLSFELFMYAFYQSRILITDVQEDFCTGIKSIKAVSPFFKEVKPGYALPQYLLTFNEINTEDNNKKLRKIYFALHSIESDGTLKLLYQDKNGVTVEMPNEPSFEEIQIDPTIYKKDEEKS